MRHNRGIIPPEKDGGKMITKKTIYLGLNDQKTKTQLINTLEAYKIINNLIANDFSNVFNEVDVILGPTTPEVAFKIGTKNPDPIAMYLADIYTVLANLVAIPGLSIPVAKDAQGLPIGIQLMSDKFEEGKLMAFAKEIGF